MGLLVLSEIVLPSGISVTNAYFSFGESRIQLRKKKNEAGESVYEVQSIAKLFVSKQARDDGLPHIYSEMVIVDLIATQLSDNLYGALYDKLKLSYPDSQND